jgi:hypothetical protein
MGVGAVVGAAGELVDVHPVMHTAASRMRNKSNLSLIIVSIAFFYIQIIVMYKSVRI